MVAELVVEARRRFLWNEILAQGAWAVSAAMAAVILLLLLGTQILEWHWLVLLPSATLCIGLWRTLRRLPAPYGIAQMIDARLGLADTLSTAVHFGLPGMAHRVSESVRDAQRARADSLARTLHASEAIPFRLPRAAYAMALLGLAASSLFALRYGLERRLDLKRPLARILQQALGLDQSQLAALEKKKELPRRPSDRGRQEGLSVDQSRLAGKPAPTPDPVQDAGDSPDATSQKNGLSRDQGKNMKGLSLSDDPKSASSEGEDGEEAAGDGNSQNQSGEEGRRSSQQSGAKGQKNADDQNGSSSGNSSLMSKFRDAMQNLLSRMRQQPGAPGAAQQQMNAQGARAGQPKQAGGNQNGRKGQQAGGQDSAQQDGQPGEDGQSSQEAASGRGASRDSEGQSSDQPGSGIGRQDGGKDVKLAEQLAAMGKISEIIGKRSANVSGDVTVEVQSNSQQLQTPYSQRAAAHSEAGAEINRDEVPVALQAYVQQYFEQVRKQSAAAERRPAPVR